MLAAERSVVPIPSLTLSTRYAGKRAADTRDGATTRTTVQLLMGRAIVDVPQRFDVGAISSALGNATFSARQYGVGGDVGFVLMRNMRVAGGYNLFGFIDRDFESLGYMHRGLYEEFGLKFDEGIFVKENK